jgi:hypothetical protein
MSEYTFRFTKYGLTSIFCANSRQQAFDIANNYAKDILNNKYDYIKLTSERKVNIWD